MRRRRSLALASVVAAGVGVMAFAVAPTATATPVGLTVRCSSGSSQIGCSVAWRDIEGRVTAIRWAVNGRALSSADDQTSFRIPCVPGNGYSVGVMVSDSTGWAADGTRVLCQRA